MQLIDGVVVALYILGTLAIGVFAARRTKTASDMFVAGGKSPWWVSGLSGFMTLKSAGTFVVWGGLAYREGIVAISINTMIGFSGLLVGWLLAGRWRRLGVSTPAEFVAFRFGEAAVKFYTWTMLFVRVFSTGVALYAVSVMFAAVVPLPEGAPFRDPATGNLSVSATIICFGAIILFYTVIGGLWAVLMTDVLQFVVLQLAVLFVLPLLLLVVGSSPHVPVPQDFFNPTTDQYGLFFLAGWVAVHFFFIGAEWAFAQRYICVPTDRDARKSAWLFGGLYLISPTIWLATPVLYRLIDANADPEQAYILASKLVLPTGMLGLMMAAMFSATASAVSAQINVFAGVLSDQIYRRLIAPQASDAQLLRAGRLFTFAIGVALVGVALLVPYAGGAEKIVLTITALILAPLMIPAVWGLLSSRIGLRAMLAATLLSFAGGLMAKFAMAPGGLLDGNVVAAWVQGNPRMADIWIGTILPNLVLAAAHFGAGRIHPGWIESERRANAYRPGEAGASDHGSARIVAMSLGGSGLLMLMLVPLAAHGRMTLIIFGSIMLLLAVAAHWIARRAPA